VGPTASGKSALALSLALDLGAEIVSCDSLQVYRGFDIGSAKPSPEDRRRVEHHLIDVVEPEELFSAADYAKRAREAIAGIAGRGRHAIVAGGTGLYLRALLEGLFSGPSRDEGLRRRLEALGETRSHALLGRVDPLTAARVHPRDRVRIVRALEVYFKTRRSLSSQGHERDPLEGFRVEVIGIALPRDTLRERVRARTAGMLEAGLLAEVERLLARPQGRALRPLQAIGYRQAVAVLQGEMNVAEAERVIVTETMRYAKRQMTWFRNQPPKVRWFEDAREASEVAQRFLLS
jgi:tRNA dimethylallyltransferase